MELASYSGFSMGVPDNIASRYEENKMHRYPLATRFVPTAALSSIVLCHFLPLTCLSSRPTAANAVLVV